MEIPGNVRQRCAVLQVKYDGTRDSNQRLGRKEFDHFFDLRLLVFIVGEFSFSSSESLSLIEDSACHQNVEGETTSGFTCS